MLGAWTANSQQSKIIFEICLSLPVCEKSGALEALILGCDAIAA